MNAIEDSWFLFFSYSRQGFNIVNVWFCYTVFLACWFHTFTPTPIFYIGEPSGTPEDLLFSALQWGLSFPEILASRRVCSGAWERQETSYSESCAHTGIVCSVEGQQCFLVDLLFLIALKFQKISSFWSFKVPEYCRVSDGTERLHL